ncbi:MAG: guanitoxin biosynthesis heme-dependent pre-guanitoxin N-hydroxylase GntA [Henriciella sp.]|uniref:guanitoxin biosynthesis heme-dependent pre-guanitoxin N-hydroxylase GntA n=1 Tax=Henriciella sp. TaxID=1968823 RepID=UPI003C724884
MRHATLIEDFESAVSDGGFPCVGAKSAMGLGRIEYFVGDSFDRTTYDLPLFEAIRRFSDQLDPTEAAVQSFVALFDTPRDLEEGEFAECLWDKLQSLHNIDAAYGSEWSKTVDRDPSSAHFSFSLCGTGYFIVGLHPNASRASRRFPMPALVFNSHDQFEALRKDGRYAELQSTIRAKDAALEGDINPMLANFGEASEAFQYSGRKLDDTWECPFVPRDPLP